MPARDSAIMPSHAAIALAVVLSLAVPRLASATERAGDDRAATPVPEASDDATSNDVGGRDAGARSDDGGAVDNAPPPEAAAPVAASPWAEGLEVEFGRGATMTSPDGRFSLTVRGRMQARAFAEESANDDEQQPVDLGFQIRRARLVFMGQLFTPDLQFYLQLGMAPADVESDLPIPLRDAVLSWTPTRDFNLRVGQMKVPFNRERVISSSALQFTDRSIVNGELTLDRDIGVQLFSNDLFGLGGVLGYQLGVFGGDGRNRLNRGYGLLYVARVQVQPLGRFDDAYAEADLSRSTTPRLSLGAGVGFNHQSPRQRSTHGRYYEASRYDQAHAEIDAIAKWWGFSLQTELLLRQAVSPAFEVIVDGEPAVELPRSGAGLMVQLGYLTPYNIEVAGRFAALEPWVVDEGARSATSLPRSQELAVALGWYILDHNLKVQAEYGRIATGFELEGYLDAMLAARQIGRVQVQVFF